MNRPMMRSVRQLLDAAMRGGVICPIDDEPFGRSWTGFQSILGEWDEFLLVLRE
jgi:hypothetical protein